MKQTTRMLVPFVLFMSFVLQVKAQQFRAQVGEESAAAVDAMLASAFPGTTPVWTATLSVRATDGTVTRLALTNVAKISGASQPEFVAGIQDFYGSDKNLSQLQKGQAISGVRQKLVAVARQANGAFQVVSSTVLEASHALTIINRLSSDPLGAAGLIITYQTIDLYQGQLVKISWTAALDANLNPVRKRPFGVETKTIGTDAEAKVIYIAPSATGVEASNYQSGTKTDIPCSAICEPTVQQLAAIN